MVADDETCRRALNGKLTEGYKLGIGFDDVTLATLPTLSIARVLEALKNLKQQNTPLHTYVVERLLREEKNLVC